jgi:hypothetical protein
MKGKRRLTWKNLGATFLLHMDNSACHSNQKTTGRLISTDITRAPHLLESPDLSPCDLCLLGFLKKSMKGMELTTEDHTVEAIPTIW